MSSWKRDAPHLLIPPVAILAPSIIIAMAIGRFIRSILPFLSGRSPAANAAKGLAAGNGPEAGSKKTPPSSGASSVQPSSETPVPFGYKTSWIAVRSADPRGVAESLGLSNIRDCSWRDGIRSDIGDTGVFVTPAVEGWVLAVGSHPEAGTDEFAAYLSRVSERLGRVYYFGTHRVVEYHAWAIADQGRVQRAFGYMGESDEFLTNIGERTPEEIAAGAGVVDPEQLPDEETVLALARIWTIDPTTLDRHTNAAGPGYIGTR